MSNKDSAESVVRQILRKTRRYYSAEEKIRIVAFSDDTGATRRWRWQVFRARQIASTTRSLANVLRIKPNPQHQLF
jgi:transposase-like protein